MWNWWPSGDYLYGLVKEGWSWLTQELGVFIALLAFALTLVARKGFRSERKISAAQLKRNRLQMAHRVHHDWIEGFLHQSLYNIARLELGLAAKPDAVEPLNLQVRRPDHEFERFPPGIRLSYFFKDNRLGQLLILGGPGSGKTTLLLELAEYLLGRAEKDPTFGIPVVFNLSSWALTRLPLADWLKNELSLQYNVPHTISKTWVETEAILPLFDGFDEVSLENREGCIEAINEFRSIQPLVVCSRTRDYESLSKRLRLATAVEIQPLKREQVKRYLGEGGKQLEEVRRALESDSELWELLETPLMLSIAMLAYGGGPERELRGDVDIEEQRTHLFAKYIDAMFNRRGKETQYYTRNQTIRWLRWLAAVLVHKRQTLFHLENLRPDWLPTRGQQRQATRATKLVVVLLLGLSSSLLFGLIGGQVFGLLGTLLFGLSVGLLLGLSVGLRGPFAAKLPARGPVDTMCWSWSALKAQLLGGLLGVLFLGLLGVLSGVLLFGLSVGFVTSEIITRASPNEGTRRSALNAIGISVVTVLILGLLLGLSGVLLFGLSAGLSVVGGLSGGLTIGLCVGLQTGGYFSLQHLAIRVLIWWNDYGPWKYVDFLDYAADRLFLRKVGGGYIFVHRMLMEYFAALTEDDIRKLSAKTEHLPGL